MRREGYELAVSRPRVITKEENGKTLEPFEELTLDIEETHQGRVMETMGARRAELLDMQPDGHGRVRLSYRIASRASMGFRPQFLSMTSGTGIMSFGFAGYDEEIAAVIGQRSSGVLISNGRGKAVAYGLFNLQERGRLFIGPNDDAYEGMVIGIHSRENDLTVTVPVAFTEAALGHVQLADYRQFAHGRHHWLAKRGDSSAVIALGTEADATIMDKTLRLLPGHSGRGQSRSPG